jgi:hypothetical protein
MHFLHFTQLDNYNRMHNEVEHCSVVIVRRALEFITFLSLFEYGCSWREHFEWPECRRGKTMGIKVLPGGRSRFLPQQMNYCQRAHISFSLFCLRRMGIGAVNLLFGNFIHSSFYQSPSPPKLQFLPRFCKFSHASFINGDVYKKSINLSTLLLKLLRRLLKLCYIASRKISETFDSLIYC